MSYRDELGHALERAEEAERKLKANRDPWLKVLTFAFLGIFLTLLSCLVFVVYQRYKVAQQGCLYFKVSGPGTIVFEEKIPENWCPKLEYGAQILIHGEPAIDKPTNLIDWFIDENMGSDSNSCTEPEHPCKSWKEVERRLGLNAVYGQITTHFLGRP